MPHQMRQAEEFMPTEEIAIAIQLATANLREVTEPPYVELFVEDAQNFRRRMENVIAMRAAKTTATYIQERKKGKRNDDISQGLGIRIYVTKGAAEEFAEGAGQQFGLTAEKIGDDLFLITLPEGMWVARAGGIGCYEKGTINKGVKPRDAKNYFAFDYKDVIRMEGLNDSSLWQNAHFDWNGTPKTRS